MTYYGDFPASHTAVCMVFDSFAASTGAPSATSNFANTDILIYKDGGTTQRSSANGITVSTSFDSQTGLQMVVIDTSDNTDAGFYAAGHEYQVGVADVTVDSQTVRFWLGCFSIERANGVLAKLISGAAKTTLADAVAHGGTLGSSTATLALSRLSVVSQSSNTAAVTATGNGSGAAILSTGGATGQALKLVGGGTSGDGVLITTTSGHGISTTATGTSKHGFISTGGDAGTSDGIKAVAGTGGTDIRATNITGTLSTLTTYTGNTPQTGDVYPLVDTEVAAILAAVDTEVAAIKTQTDKFVFTVANEVNANTRYVNGNANAAARLALAASTMIPGTVDTGAFSATTTEFESSDITTATADFYNGCIIKFTSGALVGQATTITDYAKVGSNGHFTVTALTNAPANAVTFIVI